MTALKTLLRQSFVGPHLWRSRIIVLFTPWVLVYAFLGVVWMARHV